MMRVCVYIYSDKHFKWRIPFSGILGAVASSQLQIHKTDECRSDEEHETGKANKMQTPASSVCVYTNVICYVVHKHIIQT